MAKYTDFGFVQIRDVLDAIWNIARAVNIPVMADANTGGSNALNAAGTIERLVAIGVAGMSIDNHLEIKTTAVTNKTTTKKSSIVPLPRPDQAIIDAGGLIPDTRIRPFGISNKSFTACWQRSFGNLSPRTII